LVLIKCNLVLTEGFPGQVKLVILVQSER